MEKKKYCSFSNGICTGEQLSYNDNKVFLAYPNENKIKGYMDELLEQKQLSGLCLFPWTKLSNQVGLIFCKVCTQIVSSRAFVADITYLNQNVLFELGFAMANKKITILIKESERKSEIIDILKDIKHIQYNDIQELANKLYNAIFEEFSLEVVEKNEPKVFFINANANMPIKRNIYSKLQSYAVELKLTLMIDDAAELVGHKLIALLKKIESSELIICHMVGTDHKQYNEINAHVAFLAGYAMGKAKRLIILQEKPSDRMIDLQLVRKEYQNKDDVNEIIDKWILDYKKERIKELEQIKKDEENIQIHEQLYLGNPAAEYDTNLEEYFIQTQQFREAKRLTKTLFLGRRGAGKTANFLKLYKEFSNQIRNIVVRISPSKLQLLSTIEKINNQIGLTKATAIFEMFWNYLIVTEVAISCINSGSKKAHIFNSETIKIIEEMQKLQQFEKEFDTRFNTLIDSFCVTVEENNDENIKNIILQKFYHGTYSKLKNLIKLISEEHPIILLIDNLDRDWNSTQIQSISTLINSLLEVMGNINSKNDLGNTRVVTFLRSDIYKISSRLDPDLDKRQPLLLTWDTKTLKELVAERISQIKKDQYKSVDELWNSVFGTDTNEISDTYKYVIDRTMLRPRDLLHFCTCILDELNKQNKTKVDKRVIEEAERIYSDYLLRSLAQEYKVGYPDIEEISLELFMSKSGQVYESQLKKRISACSNLTKTNSIDDIVKFCFETGLLGVKIAKSEYFSFKGYEHDKVLTQATNYGAIQYIIHPGLYSVLDIKD